MGGTRAISPRFKGSGRPLQGISPSVDPANRRAPAISVGPSRSASRFPKTYVQALSLRIAALRPRLQFPRQRTRFTSMSRLVPSACKVASASAGPLRGASTGSAGARQVMQTNTVVRSSVDCVLTRAAPLAEAPRPAREPINGRFPGSRVVALRRLPEASLETVLSGVWQALAAYSCGGSVVLFRGLTTAIRTTFPLRSLARDHQSDAAVHSCDLGLSMAGPLDAG